MSVTRNIRDATAVPVNCSYKLLIIVLPALREVRDPRFESLSGKLDNDAFRKRYKFFYDEELPKEAARLKVRPAQMQFTLPMQRCLGIVPQR